MRQKYYIVTIDIQLCAKIAGITMKIVASSNQQQIEQTKSFQNGI